MTTSRSPLRVLTRQATDIAMMLKAFERGDKVEGRFAEKIAESRGRESFKVGIVMDDKLVTIEMPWTLVRETGEVALAEFILKQMRDSRETAH